MQAAYLASAHAPTACMSVVRQAQPASCNMHFGPCLQVMEGIQKKLGH